MTMTKIPSRKTWYTYGHGPLIILFQICDLGHLSACYFQGGDFGSEDAYRSWDLSRRLAATESIAVRWVLTAPHPMGSPFDNGFVCIVSLFDPLKNGPPLFVPWVTMGGPTHSWVGPPISSTH